MVEDFLRSIAQNASVLRNPAKYFKEVTNDKIMMPAHWTFFLPDKTKNPKIRIIVWSQSNFKQLYLKLSISVTTFFGLTDYQIFRPTSILVLKALFQKRERLLHFTSTKVFIIACHWLYNCPPLIMGWEILGGTWWSHVYFELL